MLKRLHHSIILHGIANILLLIISAFISSHAVMDIQQHDTYFTISYKQILSHVGLFLLLKSGIAFWYSNKITYQKVFNILLLIDIGLIGLLCCFLYYQSGLAGIPRRYYRFEGIDSFGSLDNSMTYSIITTLITLIITQILFLITLGIDSTSKKQNLIADELLDSN